VSDRRVSWLALYSVAMGVLEAAVVVYLRELYYPAGFRFPLVILPDRVALVEVLRELTTVLMLLAVAALAARSRLDGFFVFGFLFGVWDIVYYLGLWLFLRWPESLLTWDVLFLIPVPWLGPVLYPLIVSLALIGGFLVHEPLRRAGCPLLLSRGEWLVAVLGALLVVVAFCWNWRVVGLGTVPRDFPTTLFTAGLLGGLLPFARARWRLSIP
jgi:hypothetical protein